VLTSRVVLAVSGGADSMVMAARALVESPAHVAAVATFDHGTGVAATAAADHVQRWAEARGLSLFRGAAPAGARLRTEAAWRAARWAFLREVSARVGAPVATAHTWEDQVETVLMRLLRGSGVRGLAALLASGPVVRPLLHTRRGAVTAYAAAHGVPVIADPSNLDRRHLRNRVRLELLPALEHRDPGFSEWLWSIGARAAAWRADVAALTDAAWAPCVDGRHSAVRVLRRGRSICAAEAALLWPEVAGRIGVALDRRGTERLAVFTTTVGAGRRVPLSGGVQVRTDRAGWVMERVTESSAVEGPARLAGTTMGASGL
jgi:tRNA(Ile)-lysidine synthase